MTQRVPVFFDGFELGAITVGETGALGFEYGRDWLDTRGAFPLSTTIPLRPGPHTPEITEPWLANLLPEERQLAMVARSLGLDRTDALAILRGIGADTAGALSPVFAAFRAGMAELGYSEGKDLVIDTWFAAQAQSTLPDAISSSARSKTLA